MKLSLFSSIVFGLLTSTGFGIADFASKLSTNKVGFLRTAFLLQLIGSFFVLPFAISDLGRLTVNPSATVAGILLGVVNALATLCLYKGFEVGRLSIVSPIASTAPVVAILLAVTFLGERITGERFVAISLVILGIILVSFQSGKATDFSAQVGKGTVYAIAFMLLGGLLLFGLKPVSTVLGAFLPVLLMRWVGALVLTVPYLHARNSSVWQPSALSPILVVAFFDTFANVTYVLGVIYGTVTIVSTLGGTFSAVTVLLAWSFLKERLSTHQIIGFAAIVLGVATLGALV